MSTHSSGEKATAFESEKSSSLYFELILTKLFYIKLIFFNLSICQNIKVQCKDYISELGVHGGGWAGSQCM